MIQSPIKVDLSLDCTKCRQQLYDIGSGVYFSLWLYEAKCWTGITTPDDLFCYIVASRFNIDPINVISKYQLICLFSVELLI